MFTGNEDHDIGLADAAEMTARYRETEPGQIIGGFFGGVAVRDLLAQDGCVGFRYYYGINSETESVLILVGVNEEGVDLIEGKILEMSIPCPNYCSTSNALTG